MKRGIPRDGQGMGDRPVAPTGFAAPNYKFDKRFFVCYACTRSQGEKRMAFVSLWRVRCGISPPIQLLIFISTRMRRQGLPLLSGAFLLGHKKPLYGTSLYDIEDKFRI